jgi:hypothetical protein
MAGFRVDLVLENMREDNIKMDIEERARATFVWTENYLPHWNIMKTSSVLILDIRR